ncbi:hypothetical protein A4R43_12865 [Amycolatopsis albispora]|uniref:Uncharacterized protein n=2 Tax=Amycolatopsis albispora TaxID=1804986 RepID=A0A344L5K9_9PSEU|nr:hypothetical protein A4R43_12865 [Amycolatopsis albispora]
MVTPAAAQRLHRRLGDREFAWISLRDVGLSRAQAGQVAARQGFHVAGGAGDQTDEVLLLSRRPVAEPRALIVRRRVNPHTLALSGLFLLLALVLSNALALAYLDTVGLPVLFASLGVQVLLGAALVFGWYARGRSYRISAALSKFDGRTPVTVLPSQFKISPELLVRLAAQLGYACADSTTHHGSGRVQLTFGLAGQPGYQGRRATSSPARRKWLVKRITAREPVWISLREAKLPRWEVDAVAAEHGERVVWQCTDPSDQLLLIGRGDHRPPLRSSARVRPFVLHFLVPGLLVVLGGTFGVIALFLDLRVTASVTFTAVVVLLPIVFYAPRLFPASAQAGFLAREFNGRPRTAVISSLYSLSDQLIVQVAAAFGYQCTSESSTQATGRILSFSKRTR